MPAGVSMCVLYSPPLESDGVAGGIQRPAVSGSPRWGKGLGQVARSWAPKCPPEGGRGGGGGHKAMVLVCLPLGAGLLPLHIPTHRGSECVLDVSTEPPDDLF